ncbi:MULTISPECIES: hypothetical protein [unclassified Mucilaginibacter]|uniref:hypothetical protein n=1 Tax=unclassified Mucilaginibacter TaxID=2617802 RepID=UPI0031F7211A
MASENTVPINEEENENAASRDPQDTSLGSAELNDIEKNEQAGEVEAWNRAYEASTPSYELNLDAGDFAGGTAGEAEGDPDDANLKQ